MSKIVNVRVPELNKLGYKDLDDWLAASDNHLYVGRDMTRYVKAAKGSKWGNPFKLDTYGNLTNLEKYEEYVRNTPELINSIQELDDKILGCWCFPDSCHAEVLIKLVEEYKTTNSKG